MARSRNIKPGFFTNDQLAELPALTRLLFIALWTLVDREGRIEDRPKKIKAEALPYDEGDADTMLQALASAGFITRYSAGGKKVIQVNNWKKHQNPHVKEQPSELPAQDEHQTSTVQAPDKQQPSTEQAGLIPSSLIPDSLNSDSLGGVAKAPRAARKCPVTFVVTTELIAWAASEAPGVSLDTETAKLRDHTFKNPISDWAGAWRNWMRRAQQDVGKRGGQTFRERDAEAARAKAAAWSGGLLGQDHNTIDMEDHIGLISNR